MSAPSRERADSPQEPLPTIIRPRFGETNVPLLVSNQTIYELLKYVNMLIPPALYLIILSVLVW